MYIYRAMCEDEYKKTISNQKPSFDIKRFKWFSHNLPWILHRVCDGDFNNSRFKPERYKYIVMFEWDGNKEDFMSTNEIQFDRRRNPKITYVCTVGIPNYGKLVTEFNKETQ